MAILTGTKILEEVRNGSISIDPFNKSQLNPNSYNLKLSKFLKTYRLSSTYDNLERFRHMEKVLKSMSFYDEIILDSHRENPTEDFEIPESGFLLQPGILYLGSTVERTYTDKYVPILSGRSSVGRHGMTIHVTAGFGDIGFSGTWTLEIVVTHNLVVYPNDEVCQIYFETCEGNADYQYDGRYNNQNGVVASRFAVPKRGEFNL